MFVVKQIPGFVSSVRGLHVLNRHEPIPKGAIFGLLNKDSKEIIHSHPLDDHERYGRFLSEELPIECSKLSGDAFGYNDKVAAMVKYNVPSVHTCWSFATELLYKFTAPPHEQTPENLWKCYMLRACNDLIFSSSTTVDDVFDDGEMRLGKPSWKTICPGGVNMAIADGIVLGYLPCALIKIHFEKHPAYGKLLESLTRASLITSMGQAVDLLGQNSLQPELRNSSKIAEMKTGAFLITTAHMGMLFAGITNERLQDEVQQIFTDVGYMIQTWDDFSDYCCTVEQTGKKPRDSANACTSWASSVALQHFNDDQRKLFTECYGADDEEKINQVKRLFESINMEQLYIDRQLEIGKRAMSRVQKLQHPDLKRACESYMNWFVG